MQKPSSSFSRKQQSQEDLSSSTKDSLSHKRNSSTTSHRSSNDSILYETKCISLFLCSIFRRSASTTDILALSSSSPLSINDSILDIILPYTQTCYSIRFVDDMYARKWFYIIHTKISRCLLEMLPKIEEYFYTLRNATEVKALGWLTEQVVSHEIPTIVKSWRPIFLVLTDSEVCLLSCAPVSKRTCREPDIIYPILSTR
jgi:hypothetical protein